MDIITNSITQIINNLGFPIFVALWMLFKSSKDTQQLTSIISELKLSLDLLRSEVVGNKQLVVSDKVKLEGEAVAS